ncbi:MAG: hypothetical protein CEN90_598 [Parcubacteria group bacterium Licking1014_17]|nr:MAG: hypothetical protein CEN90_598 [Parcubacteria group bacterium Licking1014_17]
MKILKFLKQNILLIVFLALITLPVIFSTKTLEDLQLSFNRTIFDAGNLSEKMAFLQKNQIDNNMGSGTESLGGWDPGITKRCIRSADGNLPTYRDEAQCGKEGNWSFYVDAIDALGNLCKSKLLTLNAPKSPLSIRWLPADDNNRWMVNMTTDLLNVKNPCGQNSSIKMIFMDSAIWGGGPLPRPQNLQTEATLNYAIAGNNGGAMVFAGWNGFWDGVTKSIEIALNEKDWTDEYPSDPLILQYKKTPTQESIVIDGKAIGVATPKETERQISIPWKYIINILIERNLITPPIGDWKTAVTSAATFGIGTYGNDSNKSLLSNLWLSNIRILNKN